MAYPDSLPIKFYAEGETPFNDNKPFGIIKKPYYQKFNQTSRIVHQIKDIAELGLTMIIIDEDGNEVKTIAAAKEQKNGIWYYSWDFSFQEQGLVDGCYKLKIYSNQIEGDIGINAPIGIFAATGTVTAYVEIDGDIVITAPIGAIVMEGINYPFVSEDFKLSDSLATVCDGPVITLYFQGSFVLGTHLYTEKEFTNWPVGYNYIARVSTGLIYAYNDVDGTRGLNQPGSC